MTETTSIDAEGTLIYGIELTHSLCCFLVALHVGAPF